MALKEAQFTTSVTNKIIDATNNPLLKAQSTRYWLKQSPRKFPGQNTDLFFWINKVSDVSFSNSEQACLRCAGLHAAWHLSLGSYHTETHHYSPLLVLIKIIIVKFLLKATTLKKRSDCFGIKCSRKRPTDCSPQKAWHIYSSHMALKCDKRYEIWSIFKKSSKCRYFWVRLSLYNIQDFILLSWGPHLEDFNI